MAVLDISRVKSVVEKYEELRPLVAATFPGYRLVLTNEQDGTMADSLPLVPGGTAQINQASFKALSGVKQIVQVMKEYGRPIEKKRLFAHLRLRGSSISKGTLTIYLSRKKDLFRSVSWGVWELVDKKGGS